MKYTGDIDGLQPVYTTRESAGGTTMTYSLDGRSTMRIFIYGALALQLWIAIAIIAAVLILLGGAGLAVYLLLGLLL